MKPDELIEANGSYKPKNLEAGTLVVEDANLMRQFCFATVRTLIMGPCVKRLELPLLVWSGVLFDFVFVSGVQIFGVIFTPFLEEEI